MIARSFAMQMAMIDSELGRAEEWLNQNQQKTATEAYLRALELLDRVTAVSRGVTRLRELGRLREAIAQEFTREKSDAKNLEKLRQYFEPFNMRVAKERGLT